MLNRKLTLTLPARHWMVLGALLFGNLFLLRFAPPTRWPMMWPQPAISYFVMLLLVVLWLQQHGDWSHQLRLWLVGGALLFLCEIYAWHSIAIAFERPTLVAILHALASLWINAVIALGVWNQLRPKDQRAARAPTRLPEVAAVVPTYGEPVQILEPVIRALMQLDYPADRLRVYVSDDGHRPEVAELARRYGAIYQQGPRRDAKAGNLNSALELIRTLQPGCELVLTQDADEVIDRSFLRRVVGYFDDAKVGFVQTPKECVVPTGDPFGNRDRIFYDSIQVGRNGDNAAFACGSGVVWRIAALEAVGGFNTWNLVEDMTTSYEIHNAGYSSVYHNELLTVGLAPDDIPGLLKQRGTWAVDTWRMFLFNNPLTKQGRLSLSQRLQYLELGLFYCTSAFVIPLMFMVPVLSLLTGDFITVEGAILFPWLLCTLLYHVVHANGSLSYAWRYWQYWIGHGPTYFKAFLTAVRSRTTKPRYVVTRKTRVGGFHGHLIWPQFLFSLVGLVAVVLGTARFGAEHPIFVATNAFIVLYYLFLLNGICGAAFYGVTARDLPLVGYGVRAGERALAALFPARGVQGGHAPVEALPLEPVPEPLIALERGAELTSVERRS